MLDDKARLQHILDAILEIEEYMTTHTEADFFSNSMLSSACIRQLEIIGEAAGRISKELRTASPTIRWKEIIGLRNMLIHEYFGVDLDIVWEIIQTDLSGFNNEVKILLDSLN
ncbi:MAG: DUF86 domain-containing protein [Candidatus Electrothrix sp.]